MYYVEVLWCSNVGHKLSTSKMKSTIHLAGFRSSCWKRTPTTSPSKVSRMALQMHSLWQMSSRPNSLQGANGSLTHCGYAYWKTDWCQKMWYIIVSLSDLWIQKYIVSKHIRVYWNIISGFYLNCGLTLVGLCTGTLWEQTVWSDWADCGTHYLWWRLQWQPVREEVWYRNY